MDWRNKLNAFLNAMHWVYLVKAMTFFAFIYLTFITLHYIHQPLVDSYAFRQTQTALTSYWILQEGLTFAYQTPVAGFPWSIPFEFPIYQILVALIVKLTSFELAEVGRFVSYFFLVACAWPAFLINERLSLPKVVPWVFCALLWTSPLYVYWGRTFMIETTALFFTLACLPYANDMIRNINSRRSIFLFILFSTLGILQKSTTTGPVILFLLSFVAFINVKQFGVTLKSIREMFYPALIIFIPLFIGALWAHYTDLVKMNNLFGSQLTSKAIASWNFGTLEQKLDFKSWQLVLWERSIKSNAGGWLAVSLLMIPVLIKATPCRFIWSILLSVLLFILPVVIFTNLHIVHEYYQIACLSFLLATLAIIIGGVLPQISGTTIIMPIITFAIIASNLTSFNKMYGIVASRTVEESDARSKQSYEVGRYLNKHTPRGTGLVIFGQDWSSEIGYHSERKSITVPVWFSEYKQLWEKPESYLGGLALSAIVICPPTDEFPTLLDMQHRLISEPNWLHKSVSGCEILIAK